MARISFFLPLQGFLIAHQYLEHCWCRPWGSIDVELQSAPSCVTHICALLLEPEPEPVCLYARCPRNGAPAAAGQMELKWVAAAMSHDNRAVHEPGSSWLMNPTAALSTALRPQAAWLCALALAHCMPANAAASQVDVHLAAHDRRGRRGQPAYLPVWPHADNPNCCS